jgi:hypothetical protein
VGWPGRSGPAAGLVVLAHADSPTATSTQSRTDFDFGIGARA